MKKQLKALVIATSVAAITGIGAVSFAAWNGANEKKDISGGQNAKIETIGFKSGDFTTGTKGKKLVPYDQVQGVTSGMCYEWVVKLEVEGDDLASYEIKAVYAGTDLVTTGDGVTPSAYKCQFATSEPTAPTEALSDVSSYTMLAAYTNDAAIDSATTATTGSVDLSTNKTVYACIVLSSDNNDDMENEPKFTFKLVRKSS